ncbi:MAG: hypothetical protein QME74_08810, partial [Candidatus Edwardsbacteria bacterium]|nr:hypothetical protein [Candidatus Edwardsbacteria bacterium]
MYIIIFRADKPRIVSHSKKNMATGKNPGAPFVNEAQKMQTPEPIAYQMPRFESAAFSDKSTAAVVKTAMVFSSMTFWNDQKHTGMVIQKKTGSHAIEAVSRSCFVACRHISAMSHAVNTHVTS